MNITPTNNNQPKFGMALKNPTAAAKARIIEKAESESKLPETIAMVRKNQRKNKQFHVIPDVRQLNYSSGPKDELCLSVVDAKTGDIIRRFNEGTFDQRTGYENKLTEAYEKADHFATLANEINHKPSIIEKVLGWFGK